MSKQPMPGHLIAVLVILGNYAYVAPVAFGLPLMVVVGLLGLPELGATLLLLLSTPLFGWFAWLVCGLCWRQAWAPRAARITAAVICGLGGVATVLSVSDLAVAVLVWCYGGVIHLWLGLYVLWALGRGDVRTWLKGASAPE